MQNQSMMMIMQAQEEEEVKREADEREESKDELKNAHEQLKRSKEARGALKVEMKKLKEMLLEREEEQRKSAQYSITGTENLKKLREKITRESQRIREKMEARRKQSTAIQSTEGTQSKSIMTMKNTSEEEKNAQEERREEAREHIEREEEKEREEQREENEEEIKSVYVKREDDVEVFDEGSSKCNADRERKTDFEVEIGARTSLGGMNGSNIGAKEIGRKRATEIRTGRKSEAKTETWKWDIIAGEEKTVHAPKMEKRASSGHDLVGQGRSGKPKVKIKGPSKRKVVDCCLPKIYHGGEQENCMFKRKIKNFFNFLFLIRRK
jgi:hypothetical protein